MKHTLMKPKYLLLLMVFLFTSCKKENLTPSGNIITETRNPGAFKAVKTASSVPVYYTYGAEHKVVIKGSDNLLANFETRISGQELVLEFQDVNVRSSDMQVWITSPQLEEINIGGSADFEVSGNFPAQQNLEVALSGSGDVNVLGQLKTNNLKVSISGSGEVNMKNVETNTADFKISGSGNIEAKVITSLKANISGSGNVNYFGNPTVQSNINGSGKVIKKG